MSNVEAAIRKIVEELIGKGADRAAVLTALNKASLDLLTSIQSERKR